MALRRGRYNEEMKLHTARLCLNCDEVHDANECPVCNSETFAYISRWVPSPEGRPRPRPVATPEAETYSKLLSDDTARPGAMRWVRRGAFGLAAISAARWLLRGDTSKPTDSAEPRRRRSES